MRNSPERQVKINLGSFVAKELIKPSDKVFVASGTSAAVTGLEILCKHPEVRIYTHSVPLAWHFMEFMYLKYLEQSAAVEVLGGNVEPTTGIIRNGNGRMGKIPSNVFVYGPHGIGPTGITGNRDVIYLQGAWKAHRRVILVATFAKLLRTGHEVIKYMGHIKKEHEAKTKVVELVVPSEIPEELQKHEGHIEEVLALAMGAGIKIHRAPPVADSMWVRYFTDTDKMSGRVLKTESPSLDGRPPSLQSAKEKPGGKAGKRGR